MTLTGFEPSWPVTKMLIPFSPPRRTAILLPSGDQAAWAASVISTLGLVALAAAVVSNTLMPPVPLSYAIFFPSGDHSGSTLSGSSMFTVRSKRQLREPAVDRCR